MKILALGDVAGNAAVEYLRKRLFAYRTAQKIDFCIVNGENASLGSGNGIDPEQANALLCAGADVITGGNHTFRRNNYRTMLDDCSAVCRPANYPDFAPGRGYATGFICGYRMLVVNVLGQLFTEAVDDPFAAIERILAREAGHYDVCALDIHAEATAEKAAIARYFDGRIPVIFGTHTHVQTADARILPKGSGFLTDLGMCGAVDSILGVQSDVIVEKMRTKLPARFCAAEGAVEAQGAIFTLNADFRCENVTAIRF